MGYTTDFSGEFEITPPLTAAHVAELAAFADERHEDGDFDPVTGAAITYPELYCQWVPGADGATLEWDGGEKFYAYVEWLEYLIEHFLAPWGHRVNGEVKWFGEDRDDIGAITVVDNVVTTKVATITW